jgi:superfamily II DNA/RNA helicase
LQALQQVEELPSDSKLDAFGQHLERIIAKRGHAGRICVLTEYLASMFDLAADMEGRGISCHELHGEMGAEDRDRVLESLSRSGDVLVTTRAAISENVNLSEFEDLVLYDLPPSKLALHELLAAFNRFGRIEPLNVHVLKAAEAEDPLAALERSIFLSALRKVPA